MNRLSREDLLLLFVLYDDKLNVFGAVSKTRHFNMLIWAS